MALIDQQAAIDIAKELTITVEGYEMHNQAVMNYCAEIMQLPSVQPNHNAEVGKMGIIRCKDCKHWNLQVGNVKGDGLGSCDFHNVNLVTGEGFCYWADRRCGSDGTD